jgi:hypothetical protein
LLLPGWSKYFGEYENIMKSWIFPLFWANFLGDLFIS